MSKKLSRLGLQPRENTIQTYLIAKAKALGGKAIKIEGENGTPDTLVKLPGRAAMLIECKRPGEEPEPIQYERLREWQATGFVVGWASTKRNVDKLLEP